MKKTNIRYAEDAVYEGHKIPQGYYTDQGQ